MTTSSFSGQYALLWSWKQKSFQVEPIEKMLETNLTAFKENRPVDFIVLAFAETFAVAMEIKRGIESK